MGRRIQDPVAEISGLCIDEEELLCLRLHPRQVTRHFMKSKCQRKYMYTTLTVSAKYRLTDLIDLTMFRFNNDSI